MYRRTYKSISKCKESYRKIKYRKSQFTDKKT